MWSEKLVSDLLREQWLVNLLYAQIPGQKENTVRAESLTPHQNNHQFIQSVLVPLRKGVHETGQLQKDPVFQKPQT